MGKPAMGFGHFKPFGILEVWESESRAASLPCPAHSGVFLWVREHGLGQQKPFTKPAQILKT
jgi:hypothetical protein